MATKRAKTTNAATGVQTNAETRGEAPAELSERTVIPVIEETPTLTKQVIESGKVRLSKSITEREEVVDVPLFREEVRVERVPVNLYVETAPAVRQEGETLIIPVVEERVVVQKKLFLVEELRVHKEVIEHHEPQPVTLRREEVIVKRINGEDRR